MALKYKGSLTSVNIRQNWGPRAAYWGLAAGAAVFFIAEFIPRLRKDVYSNIPVLGQYDVWQKYKNWGK